MQDIILSIIYDIKNDKHITDHKNDFYRWEHIIYFIRWHAFLYNIMYDIICVIVIFCMISYTIRFKTYYQSYLIPCMISYICFIWYCCVTNINYCVRSIAARINYKSILKIEGALAVTGTSVLWQHSPPSNPLTTSVWVPYGAASAAPAGRQQPMMEDRDVVTEWSRHRAGRRLISSSNPTPAR